MIRAVTFDWWHTVAETPWPDYDERMRDLRVERVEEALARAGVVVSRDALHRAYDAHTDLLVRTWKERVDLTAKEQMRAFLEFAGLDGSDVQLLASLQDAFGIAMELRLPVLHEGIEEVLRALREAGYRIGMISNTGRTWGRFLRKVQATLGIGSYFDVRVFSDEVRARKPDPRIFEEALDGLGLEPAQVVHVGDDVDADIAGAKGVGMRAVWFNAGVWPDAKTDRADAEIHDHRDLLRLLEVWRR